MINLITLELFIKIRYDVYILFKSILLVLIIPVITFILGYLLFVRGGRYNEIVAMYRDESKSMKVLSTVLSLTYGFCTLGLLIIASILI